MSNFQFSDELYYVKLRATDSQGNHNWLGWLGTNVNGAGYAGYHNAEATQPPQPGVLTVQWVTDTSTGRNYLRAVNYPGGSRYLGGSGDQGFYLFWTPGDANGDPITADVNGNSYYLQQVPISGSTQVTINRNGGSTPVSTYNNYKYLGYWQASSERIVTFEFLPVGNFSPKYENWMQGRNAIIGNRALPDIAIPGSHDAGSTSISRPLGYVMSQAQNLEIYDQLMAGSRYLDLRAKKYNGDGVWYIHHGLDWTTLKLVDVASQLAHFLKKHPQEIVIATLLVEDSPGLFNKETEEAWQLMFDQLSSFHLNCQENETSVPRLITSVTPNSMKALNKNLLLFSWSAAASWHYNRANGTSIFISPWSAAFGGPFDRDGVYVDNSNANASDILKAYNAYTRTAGQCWILHTNTPWGVLPFPSDSLHQKHIRNTPGLAKDFQNRNYALPKLNIVNIDFVGEVVQTYDLVEEVIQCNK